MKYFIVLASFFVVRSSTAQVGIGTTSPSTNAALDVTSTSKGLLLPRLNDTATVRNPSAGLLIYSRQAQAPAYHNGTRWNTFATRSTAATAQADSVTYTITGASAGAGFTNGVFGALGLGSSLSNTYSVQGGGSGGGSGVVYENVILRKPADANSPGFVKSINTGRQAVVTTLEVTVFARGSATPTYSLKLTTPYILSYAVSFR
jgi:type VI protein secretion system component Hcp